MNRFTLCKRGQSVGAIASRLAPIALVACGLSTAMAGAEEPQSPTAKIHVLKDGTKIEETDESTSDQVRDAIGFYSLFDSWWNGKKRVVTVARRPRTDDEKQAVPNVPAVGTIVSLDPQGGGAVVFHVDRRDAPLGAEGSTFSPQPEIITFFFNVETIAKGKRIAGMFRVYVPDFMVPMEILAKVPRQTRAPIKISLPKDASPTLREALLQMGVRSIVNGLVPELFGMDDALWPLVEIRNRSEYETAMAARKAHKSSTEAVMADLFRWLQEGDQPNLLVARYWEKPKGGAHLDRYVVARKNIQTGKVEERRYYLKSDPALDFEVLWKIGTGGRDEVVVKGNHDIRRFLERMAYGQGKFYLLMRDPADLAREENEELEKQKSALAIAAQIRTQADQYKQLVPVAIAQGSAVENRLREWSAIRFEGVEYLNPLVTDTARGKKLIADLKRAETNAIRLAHLAAKQPGKTFLSLVDWAKTEVERHAGRAWLEVEPLQTQGGVAITFSICRHVRGKVVKENRVFRFSRAPSDEFGISSFSTAVNGKKQGGDFLRALGAAVKSPGAIFKEITKRTKPAVRNGRRSSCDERRERRLAVEEERAPC